MTVNIQFNSAVTTGMIQNEMFCISSAEHLGEARGSAGGAEGGRREGGIEGRREGDLCQVVNGVNVGARGWGGEGPSCGVDT